MSNEVMSSRAKATEVMATQIGERLMARQMIIGTAESCTGGMVAAALTDIAGSSNWFEEGLVTYANGSKSRLLGVTAEDLERYGAVSAPVVEAMVAGVIERGAHMAVATSGVAGPGGGSPEKPVGTVWFAWRLGDRVITESRLFSGDRAAVRTAATEHALQGVLQLLNNTDQNTV